ncbi:MAG: aminoglycoside phosphotransferase, partial [Betaproteobacteria bacterium]
MSDSAPTPAPAAPAAGRVAWADPARRDAFERWLAAVAPRPGLDVATQAPASADARVRRSLRGAGGGGR